MGYSRWNPDEWARYAAANAGRRTEEIFDRRMLDPALDPRGIGVRESRDSALNPASTAIIVGLDVTGSMGMLADSMARDGLGTLIEAILDRQPVTDPHTLILGIGDAECDQAPLQATQFEPDTRLARQLSQLWLEKGGGGNSYEGYALAWYFAARHTSIDCFEKRGKKGYLFTVGDELPTPGLRARDIRRVLGTGPQRDLGATELLAAAGRFWEVFHLVVEEGSFAARDPGRVLGAWRDLIGQRAIPLSDHRQLAEVIVSSIEVCEGRDPRDVARSWGRGGGTVARALAALPARGAWA